MVAPAIALFFGLMVIVIAIRANVVLRQEDRVVLRSVRAIEPGEEICIRYNSTWFDYRAPVVKSAAYDTE